MLSVTHLISSSQRDTYVILVSSYDSHFGNDEDLTVRTIVCHYLVPRLATRRCIQDEDDLASHIVMKKPSQ
ncbi:hypothetical protein Plhal304r1_c058g0145271 [Plasmopara halstedii]